jgi:hypothetical protein
VEDVLLGLSSSASLREPADVRTDDEMRRGIDHSSVLQEQDDYSPALYPMEGAWGSGVVEEVHHQPAVPQSGSYLTSGPLLLHETSRYQADSYLACHTSTSCGVNVVLNTLTSPGMVESALSLLNAGGRFIEISKRDIFSKSRVTVVRDIRPYVSLLRTHLKLPAS